MRLKRVGKNVLASFPLIDGLFRRFIWSRIHFPEIEMRFLHNLPADAADVSIDVGAALGAYSWILNRVSRQVYAFEPGRVHNCYLSRLVFLSNIKLIRAAVGRDCGHAKMYTPGMDSNAFHSATLSVDNPVISVAGTNADEVDLVTIDAFASEHVGPGRSIDILKVDVEGYELDVFQGSKATLIQHHPLVICEIEARHNARYPEVFSLLKDIGYACYIFRDGQLELFTADRIEALQSAADLATRLSGNYSPLNNRYINNFVFQHPNSRIKVAK